MKTKVKIFQIVADSGILYGLDADGDIWALKDGDWAHVRSPILNSHEEDDEASYYCQLVGEKKKTALTKHE